MLHELFITHCTNGTSITNPFTFKQSSYLTTFSCPFGRCRYIGLLFRVAPADDMFHREIDEPFNGISNVFGIADDILIAGLMNWADTMMQH